MDSAKLAAQLITKNLNRKVNKLSYDASIRRS